MAIVRQIDSTYAGDDFVAFVESDSIWNDTDCRLQEVFFVAVHRKPVGANTKAFIYCQHRHREVDTACRCARQMLRRYR